MSVHPVASPAVPVEPPSVRGAAPPPASEPAAAPSAPAQRPDAVTLSPSARLGAVARQQASPAGDATAAARAAAVHAASPHTYAPQTTTSGYAMKVRAALARGGNLSVSQVMAELGIPQAEQAQVAAALGAAPQSAR